METRSTALACTLLHRARRRPVIIQSRVPVFEDDTASDLAERVQEQERRIYPLVSWFSAGRLSMRNNKAVLDEQELPESGHAND